MRKKICLDHVLEANFKELFITEIEWNNYKGQEKLPLITIDETDYQFYTIAERSGFQILQCEVESIPTSAICKRIDTKLRRSANDYIAIYVLKGTEHHQWVAPVRQMEKRDLVTIEYKSADKADFIFSKIDDLSFDNTEVTTIIDVKERIQGTFAINSEKVTKDFYAGFKKEHDAFAKFITGIDDQITDLKKNRNKQWYTSVMLNRLMFCYFIQKKGFLNGQTNYLRDKLEWCKQKRGEDKFFRSFYLQFLIHLFQDGLNTPTHSSDFEDVFGRIPYLNGGMFDQHQLEKDYKDIDIADEAFERLFDFFDKWRWHLDTRIEATGKDINPDVLGYIFEQYINDRAQMGAHYTKEDITEYIGRNCILPFLFDKVQHSTDEMDQAFTTSGEVWSLLKSSGDQYIDDAVKHGYTDDWENKIPADIAVGIDTTQPHLLERRSEWNKPTPEPWALPTEIWRETIERLQRCGNILDKIKKGEICQINDFITYNLDIRSFAADLIGKTQNSHIVRHFYKALQEITILDPTCGSGAFLFAAMNILEPLYEVCIDRMQEFHEQNALLFKDELEEIEHKYRSNIQYFIFKSIILRNLYGVDIMTEATEIAKLRLFLKMVAVVEVNRRLPNLGLHLLPDIDFNIRCGNTLVGYATEEDAINDAIYSNFSTANNYREKVELEMEKVSMAYNHFRTQQLADVDDRASFKEAKNELSSKLTALTDMLDKQLFSASGMSDFDQWKSSHQPFHWIAEYYQIIHGNGGFDVIIGNPPYVKEISELPYPLIGFSTLSGANLYGYCLERATSLENQYCFLGMIVPQSLVKMPTYKKLRNLLNTKDCYYSVYSADSHPGQLFSGVQQNLTIIIRSAFCQANSYSTNFIRFYNEERGFLLRNIKYALFESDNIVGSNLEISIFSKAINGRHIDSLLEVGRTNYSLFYRDTSGAQFKPAFNYEPIFLLNNIQKRPSTLDELFFSDKYIRDLIVAILNSSLFNLWWCSLSDGRHIKKNEIFSITVCEMDTAHIKSLGIIVDSLMKDYKRNAKRVIYKKKNGNSEYDQYFPSKSKSIIDEIDKMLAKHYGFTEEELDFIINYDIKYRMGEELNNEEE